MDMDGHIKIGTKETYVGTNIVFLSLNTGGTSNRCLPKSGFRSKYARKLNTKFTVIPTLPSLICCCATRLGTLNKQLKLLVLSHYFLWGFPVDD